jgi:CubicO group peptidase (beta-lactamase class C family)
MKSKPAKKDTVKAPTVKRVSAALNRAAQDALDIHRQTGLPLATWKDGQTVLVAVNKVTKRANGKRGK